jgi:hypothetical protein
MNWDWPDIVFISAEASSPPLWVLFVPTLLGAIVGGLVVIVSDGFWHRKKNRAEYIVRDYELYIAINQTINDVHSIGSKHIASLNKHDWPLQPWTVMEPTIGHIPKTLEISTEALATIHGKHATGLVHDIMELVAFRNIIVGVNQIYRDLHTQLIDISTPFSELGEGLQLSAKLDSRDPEQRRAIIQARRLDGVAKQLLSSIWEFYERALEFTEKYNLYREFHWRKKGRTLKLDSDGIQKALRPKTTD